MHFTVYILWIMLVFHILSLFQLFPSENINSHFSITSVRWSLQPKQISLLNRVCVCVCGAVNQSHKSNSSLWTGVCSSARVHSAFLLFCLAEGKLFLVMEFEKRSRTTDTRHVTTETWTLVLTAASVRCCFITLPMMQHCVFGLLLSTLCKTADVFLKGAPNGFKLLIWTQFHFTFWSIPEFICQILVHLRLFIVIYDTLQSGFSC